MAKYKVCPACGAENNPASIECDSCGCDLTSVPVLDSDVATVKTPSSENELGAEVTKKMVRICSCGVVNPAQARKCKSCNEDISDILPTPEQGEIELHFQLAEVGTSFVYHIPCGTIIIGREHMMRECLAAKPFVSRTHAKLIVEEGNLYIENLSNTNFTFVNNIKIPTGRVRLNPGDEVGLGGIAAKGSRQPEAAYFVVGIKP